MVSYRNKDGKQSYHQTDELDEAIKYVEHLRNDESVDHARIFRMEELTFEYRPYYKVELASASPLPPPPPPVGEANRRAAPAEAPAEDVDPLAASWSVTEREESPVDDEATVGAGMGRRGLFGR